MTVRLQILAGDMITLEVAPQDTIRAVKEKVFSKEGMMVERQSLFYAGEKLSDRKTLKDYKIWRNSVLELRWKKSPEGKLREVDQSKEVGLDGDGVGGFGLALSECQFSMKCFSIECISTCQFSV